jgi:DNA repair protein RadC
MRALSGRSLAEIEQWLAGLRAGAGAGDGEIPRAERVQALFELARRFGAERLVPGATFRGARDVFNHFHMRLRDARQEHFFLVLLDSRRRFRGEVAVSQGTMDRALVHPRDVFGAAVREGASAVVIVHNHPSGDPSPSPEDINVTKRLAEAGTLVGIPLLDHVVIGEERYFSLAEQGLMPA